MPNPNDPLIRILRNVAGDLVAGRRSQPPDTAGWKPLVDAVGSELGTIAARFIAPREAADSGRDSASDAKGGSFDSAAGPAEQPSDRTAGRESGAEESPMETLRALADVGMETLGRAAADLGLDKFFQAREHRPSQPSSRRPAQPQRQHAPEDRASSAGSGAPAAERGPGLTGQVVGGLAAADLGSRVTIATETISLTGTLHDVRHAPRDTSAGDGPGTWTYLVLRAGDNTDGIELRLTSDATCIVEPKTAD